MNIYKRVKHKNGKREVYLFGCKIFFYNKKKKYKLPQPTPPVVPPEENITPWRDKNAHNETYQVNHFDIDKVIVGKGTYGGLHVDVFSDGPEKLIIGNYCSIGPHVFFILASEHPYKGFSTYPFKVKFGLQEREAQSKGDIIVGDDVWIGLGSIINSGVHIGKGAIVASGSVVVKDVEPYSIVGGNPAKHIKYRFDEPIRKKLMKLDFSNLNRETIIANIDLAYEPLTEDNVDEILNKLTGNGENAPAALKQDEERNNS